MNHIVIHLQHAQEARTSSAEMQGRAKLATGQLPSLKNVLFIHFVLDVLDQCSILSLAFQRDSATLITVTTALHQVETGLSAMLARPAKHLSEFLDKCGTVGGSKPNAKKGGCACKKRLTWGIKLNVGIQLKTFSS